MKMETALAKASFDNVTLRDPNASDHKMSFDELEKADAGLRLEGLLCSANYPAPLNVDQPEFLKETERQLTATSIADWKMYLRWQVLNAFADSFQNRLSMRISIFQVKQLAGVGELKPRATRCAEQTDRLLGEALGQEYVKRYFPPEAKQRATAMVNNILAAMHDTIEGADWMTPATKQKAMRSSPTVSVKVGYPDRWKDYSSIDVHAMLTSMMCSALRGSGR